MAGQEAEVFLAKSERIRSLVCACDLANLSDRHGTIWTSSAGWDDLLVRVVGFGVADGRFGSDASFDDIRLGPAHHRSANDWCDRARLYDCTHYHLFRAAVLELCVYRPRD